MRKIGFKWGNWGWGSSSSESKWENSYFGGYTRLISDYPRVVIDFDIDFDFAPIKFLSYFEKEKLLKIFLSKANSRLLISDLMQDAETKKESSFIHGTVVKTTINILSKQRVLNVLNGLEKEYSPLFKHYEDFILNSEISFKQPESKSGDSGKNSKDKDQKQSDKPKNQQGKDQNKQDGEDKDKNQDKQDQGQNQNNGGKKSNPKNKENDSPSDDDILKNLIEFKKLLNEIREEEYKFNSLSTFNQKTKTEIQPQNHIETYYTKEEKDVADNLTKMLDISFDPTEDIVKNLRLGKLDISKIAEVPAGNIAIYKQSVENQTTKPFSVAILCDESASMGYYKVQSQHSIVKSLYMSFSDIIPQDKIFIYGHSGGECPELYIYHDLYNPNFLNTIDTMLRRSLSENYDGPIIEEVYKNVRAATNDRIIFIVLSDGAPCGRGYGTHKDIVNMRQIIEKCKRDEFVTIGIGIQSPHVKNLYQYSSVVNDLNDMPKKVSHIVNHVVKTEFQ